MTMQNFIMMVVLRQLCYKEYFDGDENCVDANIANFSVTLVSSLLAEARTKGASRNIYGTRNHNWYMKRW